jgi:GAF domain-containing protein
MPEEASHPMPKGARDLPKLLQQADAAYTTAAGSGGVGGGKARADRDLSSFIRLSLDDLEAAQLLQNAAAHLAPARATEVTAATILDQTMALTAAELGNVQIVEPPARHLRIIAQAGFGQEFLDHFMVVDDATSACGRAAAQHNQTVIVDVDTDEDFVPHRDIAAASKFRSVQSTPLIDAGGALVGMVSTHFPQPGAPTERALELTRLYALLAGEALARSLPGHATPELGPRSDVGAGRPEPTSTLTRAAVLDLTGTVVRSLLSAGLSLAGAQSLIGDGAAGDRVAAAIDELDQALGNIRSVVLELHS